MILFQIDIDRIACIEPECNPPGPIYGDGEALRFALQTMEMQPGQIHVFRQGRLIESIEQAQAFLVLIRPNSCASAILEKLAQTLLTPGQDHSYLSLNARQLSIIN